MFFILISLAALAAPGAEYHPQIDAAQFVAGIDSPYLPAVPGTVYTLKETSEGKTLENKIEVTHDTKEILGVKCTVIRDRVFENGTLTEDTYDWLAQDKQGNVWYFGEDTKEIHGKTVSTEGSWMAGVGPNQPGILLPGSVAIGEPYRQEYSPGHAEDMGQIIAVDQSVTVPAGTYAGCAKTKEWSLLEAGIEYKWYCRGVGVVREEGPGKDEAVLLSMKAP